jgi:hypothetical protein
MARPKASAAMDTLLCPASPVLVGLAAVDVDEAEPDVDADEDTWECDSDEDATARIWGNWWPRVEVALTLIEDMLTSAAVPLRVKEGMGNGTSAMALDDDMLVTVPLVGVGTLGVVDVGPITMKVGM